MVEADLGDSGAAVNAQPGARHELDLRVGERDGHVHGWVNGVNGGRGKEINVMEALGWKRGVGWLLNVVWKKRRDVCFREATAVSKMCKRRSSHVKFRLNFTVLFHSI